MANNLTTQIVADGPKNFIVKVVGILDTSDVAPTAIITPSTMSSMTGRNQDFPTQVRIDDIDFAIQEGLSVRFEWDATAPVYALDLVKTGNKNFVGDGGLQNNAGTGKTGNVLLSTQGWTTGSIMNFTCTLRCVKQSTVPTT